jgi:hypothetical protein
MRTVEGPGIRPRPSMARACAWMALAGLAGATACTEYVPASIGGLAPEAKVAITLTATGMDSLERALGPGVQRVSGRYTATNGDAIVLRVDATEGPRGPERRWSGESVALPRRFVGQVELARVSRTRTALATVGAIGALVALNAGVNGAGKSQGVVAGGAQGGK